MDFFRSIPLLPYFCLLHVVDKIMKGKHAHGEIQAVPKYVFFLG